MIIGMKQNKIAVIGCGIAALPILKKARELEIITYCFSLSVNTSVEGWYDHHIIIDYLDASSIIEACRKIGVDGVIATGENTTATTAQVARALGLPGNKYNGEFIANNKYLERKSLENSKYVLQPAYYVFDGKDPQLPVIVKATDSSGKKGISIARTKEEFDSAILYSREVSKNGIILLEEYLEGGVEYSIECLSAKGKHQIIQVTQKNVSGPPHFSELGHHEPGVLDIPFEQLKKAIDEILDKTGITNSLSHVEVKIIDGKIYFIELGARGGGDRISDTLVYLSTDFDIFKSAIEISLGTYEPVESHCTKYAGIYFLCKQTEYLLPLFSYAMGKEWCKEIKIPSKDLEYKNGNDDGNTSGYLIYQSDHMITMKDLPFIIDRINSYHNALSMLCEFTRNSGRSISDEDMTLGMLKFINQGNVIGCYFNNKLYGMLNVYCNHLETRDAYINNVEILNDYRGLGLSKKLLHKAYEVVTENGFKSVSLEVAIDNTIAVNLYQKEGFLFTNNKRKFKGDILLEMRKFL